MYLEKLKLHNYRCYEDLEIDFHKQLTVIVGKNGAGKTTILEAAAIALGTWFVGFNDISTKGIDKKTDPLRKAYQIGMTDDVQAQFPVEIEAWGKINMSDENSLHWKRGLNTPKGTMTTKDAKEIVEYAADYQKALSEGRTDIYLPIVAYYGTGRLWDYHRQKKIDIFKMSSRTNGYIDCLDGTANVKLMMEWFLNMTINKYQRQEENLASNPELDTVYLAMENCLCKFSGYSDVKIRFNMNTKELDVYYSEKDGQRMRIPLNQLKEAEFWCNITLGIFGSSLLTLISSVVGYRVERKRVFEKFFCYTNKILKQINQYQEHMTLEEKIDFLLKYIDTDKIELDSCLGDIDLLFDLRKKKFEYIYNMIYKPLRDLERAIRKHEWHFRWHKDGSGKGCVKQEVLWI